MKKKSKLIGNAVNHPKHYTSHPSGIEAIDVCGWMKYNTGCAFKYLYRLDKKWDSMEDLKKTRWYINREGYQSFEGFVDYGYYTVSEANKMFNTWIADKNTWLSGNNVTNDKILKIVGKSPGNIEKAICFIYLADVTDRHDPMIDRFLLCARTFVRAEIRKRTREQKTKLAKKQKRVA